jgi:outer membrane protein, adhesin transport system
MKKNLMTSLPVVFSVAFFLAPFSMVHAETLQEAVGRVLDTHDRVAAAKADLSASKSRVKETFANSWTPQLEVASHLGFDIQSQQASAANSEMVFRELDFTLTQRLWDWGKANADIAVTKHTQGQMEAGLDLARQTLILDAVTAHINLTRSQKMVDYATESIVNIQRQSEVEDARVALGKGYSTDVLQVKTQLAGAEARLVQAKGALLQAKNHIRTVYLRDPEEVAKLETSEPSYDLLPETVDEAVAYSISSNPAGKQLARMTDMLKSQEISMKKATFYPEIYAIFEHKMKKKVAGVADYERESFGKVEFTFPFNLGLSGLRSIKAARKDAEGADRRHRDLLLQLSEATRSSWDNLATAKANAKLLNNQAILAAKFLELAREERKLDKRTLLDVLNGETALINAQSDAASAEADVKIAYYTLIQSMGRLSIDLLGSNVSAKLAN